MKKNVYIKPIHSEGERLRKIDEAAQLAMITKSPKDLYEELAIQMKPLIIQIVERAFRRYCKAHSADIGIEELEWKRFKKILNGML